ncbi:protein MKS1-like [Zingiber officinale]|uniref:protein MKS1-like n=1 Tax=Zingiber officinale TaxID=94328 RepID=UPI001C4B6C73|nr:protein MKS1-like [Zingiber officinale]XP_042461998.1 protein MKS1-like [Zingiber officinale]XP_042461999.1 protein MKS1-like [Zingiber officinale]
MDPSDLRPSPRQEMHLKGPRPSPLSLKVSKDSHTIRKPLAAPPPPHRDPVIIYSVSPKVIHADPSEFMALVQKLTGPDSAISPAARIASFEKSSPPADVEPALFPGILSPMPAELPPISPNLFSPSASDPIFSLGLSPDFADKNPNANWGSNLLTSPNYIPSPGAFWELLHQCPGF